MEGRFQSIWYVVSDGEVATATGEGSPVQIRFRWAPRFNCSLTECAVHCPGYFIQVIDSFLEMLGVKPDYSRVLAAEFNSMRGDAGSTV
jgi:hypothetical protein